VVLSMFVKYKGNELEILEHKMDQCGRRKRGLRQRQRR
jgi:hypothetical protein